jgi:hypothetical protein
MIKGGERWGLMKTRAERMYRSVENMYRKQIRGWGTAEFVSKVGNPEK